jgi:hypothetical protein
VKDDPALCRPEDWEAHAVFRETWLSVRWGSSMAAILRRAGRALYYESLQENDTPAAGGDLSVPLAAAASDLRNLQGFLATLGRGVALGPPASFRSGAAQRVAQSLGQLAAALEQASRTGGPEEGTR